MTVKEKYNVCRVGLLMLTCCNITQLLPSDASGITLLVVVNLFDYVIILCSYHKNDMHNATQSM